MTHQERPIHDALGDLLRYPDSSWPAAVAQSLRDLSGSNSPAAEPVAKFSEFISGQSLDSLQELFTRTFDINPVCALEVGWHLFGERYERGTFIVNMRQTLRRLHIPESTELPDHLIHVLQALGRMDPEESDLFATRFVLPALEKMIGGMTSKPNAYTDVLNGIASDLRLRHGRPAGGDDHVKLT